MSLALFRVGNFLSINDTIELSFIPDDEFGTDKGCTSDGFLQIAALFGANASGKTNIILAFDYLRYLVTGEHSSISINNFGRLNGDVSCPFNESSVTHFELFFKNAHMFNLSYTVDYDSLRGEVIEETLIHYESDSEGIRLLERNGSEFVLKQSSMFNIDVAQSFIDEHGLQTGISVIRQLEENNIDWAPSVFTYVELNDLHILASNEYECRDIYSYNGIYDLKMVLDCLIDLTDVSDIYLSNANDYRSDVHLVLDQLPDHEYCLAHNGERMELFDIDEKKGYDILFVLGSKDESLKYTQLSSGVKRIIDILLRILSTKIRSTSPYVDEKRGITSNIIEHVNTKSTYTYVYDEICYALHPTIVNKLIKKLLKAEKDSQFVMTFHESEFLISDDIRKDEIWFIKKNDNQTTMESLSQFDCSNSSDVKNEYLNNRYEGIPRFNGGLY